MNRIAFIGLGYIGLPTAVAMAQSGSEVVGIDVSREKIEQINNGRSPIVEDGLEQALREVLSKGVFEATAEPPTADAFVVAVPTPFQSNHEVDMSFILSAAESIAPKLQPGNLVILESTSPPGTTRKMAEHVMKLRPDLQVDNDTDPSDPTKTIYFAHCPERILPGNALEELRTNDRIIGGMSKQATTLATEVYRTFCEGELLATNDVTAEMAKLTENSFRDVNIAFANELSVICDGLGINVWELINLANHHPRVNILEPGPGVGGHCIAVDPWFIVSADRENSTLIRTAREVNDSKPEWVLKKVKESVTLNDTKIGVLGLAFKADIDDLRESPSLKIAREIVESFPNNQVLIVEPNIEQLPQELANFDNVLLTPLDEVLQECETIALLVDHSEFKAIPSEKVTSKHLIDSKGIWTGKQAG
ncbi:UDP-N-acetyl-D-mannosamine dehydrogenase [Corynebacterium sp. 20_84]